MSLRGFGVTFDIASGRVRNWYIDREGAKRWADNDELVDEPARVTTKGESNANR